MFWKKAENLQILKEKWINIPDFIIVPRNNTNPEKLKNFLKNDKKYILRPSFENEDSEKSSFAWFFKSIFPISKNEIIKIFSKNNLEKEFWWENYILKSIIIQEFIENADYYGVYFSRNPENIFLPGFYEIWKNNLSITSGIEKNFWKLNYFLEKDLEFIWNKLEKIFNFPQDIEFCIKNNKIFIFQSRHITTGNISIHNFDEINKISGIFTKIDFDEISENQDIFSFKILENLFNCIYINGNIFFKKTIFPKFIFKNYKNIENQNLKNFLINYKSYLISKFIFQIIKIFSFQKLDKNILQKFFKNYKYSFLQNEKSNLDINFDFKSNFITNYFLKIEKIKNNAFNFLEKYKQEYFEKNFIKKEKNIILDEKLVFLNGKIIFKKTKNEKNIYIYKWKISGILTDLGNFNTKNKNQILFVENLDFFIFDKLDYISGIIVKNGNLLSHNSIIIREYKIPCIIKYRNFENLKNGDFMEII